jgi:hypothetical protein
MQYVSSYLLLTLLKRTNDKIEIKQLGEETGHYLSIDLIDNDQKENNI